MERLLEKLDEHHKEIAFSFFKELGRIYGDMDREYLRTAENYGFECRGCENNCCLTRFYHHTVLEYAFLMEGFHALDLNQKEQIRRRSRDVIGAYENADELKTSVRAMCPLNEKGLCLLYEKRPMICRLHGLPHELKKATGQKILGPGCEAFDLCCKDQPYLPLDRTPFYIQMAGLEQRLRQALGYSSKIKLTIADRVASSKI